MLFCYILQLLLCTFPFFSPKQVLAFRTLPLPYRWNRHRSGLTEKVAGVCVGNFDSFLYATVGNSNEGDISGSFVATSCQLIEYQLLLAVESLGYHSAAVYIPCTDTDTDNDGPVDSTGDERTFNDAGMQLLCEYSCPTHANKPAGTLSTFDISSDDDMTDEKLGLLVFADVGNDFDSNNDNIDDSNNDKVEVVDEVLMKRERLLGGSLRSIRMILKSMAAQTSFSSNSATYFQGGKSNNFDSKYLVNEASSMIVTSRTLLKMVGKRLKAEDEIGLELLDNLHVQLDSLSALIRNEASTALLHNDIGINLPSRVVAELANDVDHVENLPLNIVSYSDDFDEGNDINDIDTSILETTSTTKTTTSIGRKTTVSRVDNEFWSASKQEVVISIDESEMNSRDLDVEIMLPNNDRDGEDNARVVAIHNIEGQPVIIEAGGGDSDRSDISGTRKSDSNRRRRDSNERVKKKNSKGSGKMRGKKRGGNT